MSLKDACVIAACLVVVLVGLAWLGVVNFN